MSLGINESKKPRDLEKAKAELDSLVETNPKIKDNAALKAFIDATKDDIKESITEVQTPETRITADQKAKVQDAMAQVIHNT